jgi:hypothetical protein
MAFKLIDLTSWVDKRIHTLEDEESLGPGEFAAAAAADQEK